MSRTTLSTLVLALLLPATAFAHVSVRPAQSKPGADETYAVRVPTEKAIATTSVELEVPDGMTILKVTDVEGAKHEEKKTGDRITVIIWTGEIKPQESATFTFTAKNPATGEKITWKIQQKYADGTVSNWTPATTLSAAATAAVK
jgi:uncharacterized protein YcnI